MRTDQYGEPIPEDLVILDLAPEDLAPKEVKLMDRANWYVARHGEPGEVLLVSFAEIEGLTETDPRDAGVDLEKDEIMFVDHVLHRWERGRFYHA